MAEPDGQRAAGTVTGRPARRPLAENAALRKRPSGAKGRRRVESLLEAASAVFVEKGFDATTMRDIVDRAGVAVGSLYQFFPTKDAIAYTLLIQCGNWCCEEWAKLRDSGEAATAETLAVAMLETSDRLTERYPSFVPLLIVRIRTGGGVQEVRRRMAASMMDLLRSRMPNASDEAMAVAALLVRDVMRSEIDVEADLTPEIKRLARAERTAILTRHFRTLMDASDERSPPG